MPNNLTAKNFIIKLSNYASIGDAKNLQRFFKTGPGEYGEGDKFIGVKVPNIRKVCKEFKDLPMPETKQLIYSNIHEQRMGGLIILVNRYEKANPTDRQAIYNLYVKAIDDHKINNWDLVDVTCAHIVGGYYQDRDRSKLIDFASSDNLWKRRVAMISTLAFIIKDDARTTIIIAKRLLNDKHDLIHKAVGWMLREVGKRVSEQILIDFLDEYFKVMPRTMLRYACEKLTEEQKAKYYLRRPTCLRRMIKNEQNNMSDKAQ